MILAGILLVIIAGVLRPPAQPPGSGPGAGDPDLYRAVARRVQQGQDYYVAAAAEQRARLYPLRPFTTIRPPLLTRTVAAIGPGAASVLLILLAVTAAIATTLRIAPLLERPWREMAIVLTVVSSGSLVQPGMWVWHEIWAGLLVALALACPRRWWPISVVLGLVASLIRELVLPFPLVMAFLACREGRRGEACAWGAAVSIALGALAMHALAATAVQQAGDRISPGWLMVGGWPHCLMLARQTSLLIAAPRWVTAIATPLALLGWLTWPNSHGRRCAAMLAVWLGSFLFVGRADNCYWGFLFAPLLPIGLALAPPGIVKLWRAAGVPPPLLWLRFPAKA